MLKFSHSFQNKSQTLQLDLDEQNNGQIVDDNNKENIMANSGSADYVEGNTNFQGNHNLFQHQK